MSDKELVEGCIAGKAKYQELLYHRFAGAMFNICLRYSKTSVEAEDMLQEVFVKVFLNIKNFRFESTLGYWIKRLTINALLTHQKKKRPENSLVDMDEAIQEIPAITVNADAIVPMNVLTAMIRELPDGYRTIFNMREVDGYELQEIADELHCSNANVRSQLCKAKVALKKKIEKWLENEI